MYSELKKTGDLKDGNIFKGVPTLLYLPPLMHHKLNLRGHEMIKG